MHPILLRIGNLTLHSYGLMLAIGCALGIWRAARNSHRAGITETQTLDVGILVVLVGLIGARLTYTALNWREYIVDPLGILYVWDGGLTFFGGLALGGIAGLIWALRARVSVRRLADLAAPTVALSYGIARIGCFLNGCCYGVACSLPWAVRFHADGGDVLTPPSHPVQLYASALSLLIFAFLVWLERRGLRPGRLFAIWLILSSLERLTLENFRRGVTAETIWGPVTQAQVVSLMLMMAGLALYVVLGRRRAPAHA